MAMFNNQRVFQWDDCFLGETLRPGLPNKVLALRTEGQRHPERLGSAARLGSRQGACSRRIFGSKWCKNMVIVMQDGAPKHDVCCFVTPSKYKKKGDQPTIV